MRRSRRVELIPLDLQLALWDTAGDLLERDFNLGIAAGRCCIDGSNYPFNVSAQCRPLLISENDKGDFAARQVLLIPDVFVSRQQNLKARGLGDSY